MVSPVAILFLLKNAPNCTSEQVDFATKRTTLKDFLDPPLDTLLVVFGGREAPSKSSQSVPCIVRDGTAHHFGGVCALCGAP